MARSRCFYPCHRAKGDIEVRAEFVAGIPREGRAHEIAELLRIMREQARIRRIEMLGSSIDEPWAE